MNGKTDSIIDWKPIWWTAIIVAISTIVIGGILQLLMKNVIYKSSYDLFQKNVTYSTPNGPIQGFFLSQQADYYPLLFLLVVIIITFAAVLVYRLLLPKLPSNWVYRGLLVGGFLFLAGDLPDAMIIGYTTLIPGTMVQGFVLTTLANRLINGCILTYCYNRFSIDYDMGKSEKTATQSKAARL